jgi:hypothetical protein
LFDIIVVNKVAHELAKVAFNQKNLVFWVDTKGAEGEDDREQQWFEINI